MIMCVLSYPVSFHMLQLLLTGRPISSCVLYVLTFNLNVSLITCFTLIDFGRKNLHAHL